MRKEVTCTKAHLKEKEWNGDSEDRQGEFIFSIADSSSIPGGPKQQHRVRVRITEELIRNWGLTQCRDDVLTKVLFYYAMEYVRQELEATRDDPLPERGELILKTSNCTESRCPVRIQEIQQVVDFTFGIGTDVRQDERTSQSLER